MVKMKRMLFGIGLLLSGTAGFAGWSIAVTQTVQPGARSTVLACCSPLDLAMLLFFTVMGAAGLVISIREFRKKD